MKSLVTYISESINAIPNDVIKKIESMMHISEGRVRNDKFPGVVEGAPIIKIVGGVSGRHVEISNLIYFEDADHVIEVRTPNIDARLLSDIASRVNSIKNIDVRISFNYPKNDHQVLIDVEYRDGLHSRVYLQPCEVKRVKEFDPEKEGTKTVR